MLQGMWHEVTRKYDFGCLDKAHCIQSMTRNKNSSDNQTYLSQEIPNGVILLFYDHLNSIGHAWIFGNGNSKN